MNRVFTLVVFCVVAGVGVAITYQLKTRSWLSSSQPALGTHVNGTQVSSNVQETRRNVVALGRLEPADGAVEVSNILTGDLLISLVEEGTHVEQDGELGRLDQTFRKTDVDLANAKYTEASRFLDAERASAQTQLSNAGLALRQAIEGAAIEVEAQEKQVELLRLELEQVGNDLTRMNTLHQSKDAIVSTQELEHQRLLRDKTAAETAAAEAILKRLKQTAKFNQETAQANVRTMEVALEAVDKRSTLESLKVQLRLAEEKLGRTIVTAPISGTVLKIYTRAGESIAEKPILQMADLREFDCITEVFETDINLVSIGDLAQVRSRAFRGSFDTTFVTGHVKRIGNAMPARELTPLSPLEPIDRHVVQVEVDLSKKTGDLVDLMGENGSTDIRDRAQALVNLQVEVTFPGQPTQSLSKIVQ